MHTNTHLETHIHYIYSIPYIYTVHSKVSHLLTNGLYLPIYLCIVSILNVYESCTCTDMHIHMYTYMHVLLLTDRYPHTHKQTRKWISAHILKNAKNK